MALFKPEEAYLEKPNTCPSLFCGSESLTASTMRVDGAYATQQVCCDKCGAEWEDHYALTGYTLNK